ncbi:MAG: glycosyltransferase family 4 protein, partial [Candidatus Bathyarchaeota archaeon]|nr:glycosyltransferase family 4 protein [Candidatus Bathyarchaeota archaeon]
MKICYLNYSNPLTFHGGAERVVLREAKLVAQSGNDVVIITTHSGKNVRSEKLSDGKIKAWFLPDIHFNKGLLTQKCLSLLFSFHNPLLTTLVDQILRIEKPDIVHIHNPDAMSISVVNVAKRLGCKVVQTFHGYHFECPKGSLYRRSGVICSNPLPICKIYKQIFRNIGQRNDSIIALCSYVRERLIKAGYNPSNIVLIPNSLQESHKTFFSRAENKEILFVGRMVKAKGVHVLIKALAKVKKICDKEFVVNLIGDGEDKAYFESLTQSLGVKVNFLGNVSDTVLHKHYQEAYAVIVPSLFPELFGIVVLEAMSHGKPVIASNIGGLPDLVLNGQTGLLFEPNEVDALAECIKSVLTEEELAVDMGYNALEMSKKFSDTNHLERLLDLYSKVSMQGRT